MYRRETRRRNSDGSTTSCYQLAENDWDKQKGCAVARVVYNFGRADQLDRDKLKRLAGSILRLFSGEEALAAEPGVRVLDAWPYGGVFVLEQLWRELEINQVLWAARAPMSARCSPWSPTVPCSRTPSSTASSSG